MDDELILLAEALFCQECRRPWIDGHERWRLYVSDEPDPATVPYCPECAHREFDPD